MRKSLFGRTRHGVSDNRGVSLCCTSRRPGSPTVQEGWLLHIASDQWWNALDEWTGSVGTSWVNLLDFATDLLELGKCVCAVGLRVDSFGKVPCT